MLLLLVHILSFQGCKYHDMKSNKYQHSSKRFAYHVYMMEAYVEIMGKTLVARKLRKRYLGDD